MLDFHVFWGHYIDVTIYSVQTVYSISLPLPLNLYPSLKTLYYFRFSKKIPTRSKFIHVETHRNWVFKGLYCVCSLPVFCFHHLSDDSNNHLLHYRVQSMFN